MNCVLLKGVAEINTLFDRLSVSFQFSGQSSEWILPLHSSVASEDQKKVFMRPPENIRKVIFCIQSHVFSMRNLLYLIRLYACYLLLFGFFSPLCFSVLFHVLVLGCAVSCY